MAARRGSTAGEGEGRDCGLRPQAIRDQDKFAWIRDTGGVTGAGLDDLFGRFQRRRNRCVSSRCARADSGTYRVQLSRAERVRAGPGIGARASHDELVTRRPYHRDRRWRCSGEHAYSPCSATMTAHAALCLSTLLTVYEALKGEF